VNVCHVVCEVTPLVAGHAVSHRSAWSSVPGHASSRTAVHDVVAISMLSRYFREAERRSTEEPERRQEASTASRGPPTREHAALDHV